MTAALPHNCDNVLWTIWFEVIAIIEAFLSFDNCPMLDTGPFRINGSLGVFRNQSISFFFSTLNGWLRSDCCQALTQITLCRRAQQGMQNAVVFSVFHPDSP
ncbi:hypothetical protein A0H81_13221 [Grifola frondosa]|uniref:Uncharacterized protein n=1 Tax=Grifola frondosa TaxID=5627 RepID=A0A1C7LRR6_GRIFR|nr:hypothetical protein A0H81_13221 [Grifola frondosa]